MLAYVPAVLVTAEPELANCTMFESQSRYCFFTFFYGLHIKCGSHPSRIDFSRYNIVIIIKK